MLGKKRQLSVKNKIFIDYMLFFAVVALITVVVNFIIGFAFFYSYKWILMAALAIFLAFWASRSRSPEVVHRVGIYIAACAVLPISWLSSSGIFSPAITYSLLLLIMTNYLLHGIERIVVNIIEILLTVFLISFFFFKPEFFIPLSPRQQYLDWIINIPLVFSFATLQLILFEKAYEEEKRENEVKTEELARLSETDYLTGLFNRLHLKNDLASAASGCARTGTSLSVLFIDIDHFKPFNDYYGHIAGDECLRSIAGALLHCLERDSDKAFRYGGEEFFVLLPYTDTAGALHIATKIQKAIRELAIPHVASAVDKNVTVSIGIVTTGDKIKTADQILAAADDTLYKAKNTGRNRIVVDTKPVKAY